MSSFVVLLLLMATVVNDGTLGFVFGPLAAFTASQETSTAPVVTTPVQRRPNPTPVVTTPVQWRPNPTPVVTQDPSEIRFVYPDDDDDDDFSRFDKPRPNKINPNQIPHRNSAAAGVQGDAIFFDGPSSASSKRYTDRDRLRPQGIPPQGRPLQGMPPQGRPPQGIRPEEPPSCACPTTSEFNPVCVEYQGSRMTLLNTSEFHCAEICNGPSVKLLFHGTCQRTISHLTPFIHR